MASTAAMSENPVRKKCVMPLPTEITICLMLGNGQRLKPQPAGLPAIAQHEPTNDLVHP